MSSALSKEPASACFSEASEEAHHGKLAGGPRDGADANSERSMEKSTPAQFSMSDPSQFPDGGWKAWLCVAGGFCCAFCSFGWVNAIGVFQQYYEDTLLSSYSPSTIAWIPSLESFFMFVGAPFIGKIYDRSGPQWLLIVGTFMHVFGIMMASLSTKYYQLILSQGICSPIGASMVLYPAMSCIITWFLKTRGLALGIMVSGSSLGGVLFPIMVRRLIPEVGFPWTMRICGFIILALLIVANLGVRARVPPTPSRFSVMDFIRPFTEPVFAVVCIANWFGFLGLFIPFDFLPVSAVAVGMSTTLSSYLISMLNAGSIFGRIFPGWASDKLGRFNIQIAMCTASFIFNFAIWLPARGNAVMMVFAVLYGAASGSFVSLAPAIIAQITSDVRTIGTRTGTMFGFISVAALVGNPIAGALVDRDRGGYEYAQIFTGVVIAVATVIFVVSKAMCKDKFFKKF